jgi:hypothetical protein
MLENELKNIWKNSSKEELVKFNKSKLILDLDSKLENFDKKIKKRNMVVLFASIYVIISFTILFFLEPELLIKIACLIVTPWALLQIYLTKKVKKYKVDNYSLPLKKFLLKRQQYLIKERKLYDTTLLYWNILPSIPIFTLFILGESLSGTDLIIAILFFTSFLVIIFLCYKWVVKKKFDPLIKKVEATIANLDSGE